MVKEALTKRAKDFMYLSDNFQNSDRYTVWAERLPEIHTADKIQISRKVTKK